VRSDFGKVVIPEALNAPQSKWGYVPSDSPLGRVVVAALPAGDYEIATVLGKSPRFKSSHAPTFDIGSDAIDLRFTVRPGQITYLGSVVFGFPDWLSYSRADGPLRVALVDTHDRDAKVVTERYPALGRLPERDTAGAGPAIRERKYYLHLFGEGGTPKD
jgi:hypothetical protein